MKRIGILVVMLMLFCGTCFAEHWEYIYAEDFYNDYYKTTFHNEYYIDTDSIKTVQVGLDDIIKAKIKIVNQTPNEYFMHYYWVNRETKQSKLALSETYESNKLTKQLDFRNQDWRNYDPNKDKEIDEILKRTE